MTRRACIFAFASLLLSAACATVKAGKLTSQLRRPVAAVPFANGEKLLVANERSGSVSVVDLTGRRIVGEQTVGQALSDLMTDARTKTMSITR